MTNTHRLDLPLLVPGQGQKDMTHNEALLALDMLVQPVVESSQISAPPETRSEGQSWIVPVGGSGAWQGHDNAIAYWSAGGWRFASPAQGWMVWAVDVQAPLCWNGTSWRRMIAVFEPAPAVSAPASGSVVDTEARSALTALISSLTGLGLLAPNS